MSKFQHRYPTKCPGCNADLTLPASLVLHFNVAGCPGDVASWLDPRGWLEDVDDLIAHGHHSGTNCKACGKGLDAYEILAIPAAAPETLDRSKADASFPSHDVTAVPKLLAACQAVVVNWEHGDLAHAARMCAEAVESTEDRMPTNRQALLEQLLAKAEAAGLEIEDLDEAVHDMAASIASDVNNTGIDGQLAFLLDNMGYAGTSTRLDELAEIVHTGEL